MGPNPETADTAKARASAWGHYWASGANHSLPGTLPAHGGDALRALWRTAFGLLPEGARVIDIGCGSGILGHLALTECPGGFQLDAIDLVATLPQAFPRPAFRARCEVRFHGGVAAEHLPFEANSFDLAVSQFGIEYADACRAGAELRRVLKPEGRIALLVHAVSSVAVAHARAERPHAEWLLGEQGLFQNAARVQPFFARAATPEGLARLAGDAVARTARAAFNAAAAEAETRASGAGGGLCADALALAVQALALTRQQPEAGAQALAVARRQVAEAALRSRELVACALDAAGAAALAAHAGVPGATVVEASLSGQPFGWWIAGARGESAG